MLGLKIQKASITPAICTVLMEIADFHKWATVKAVRRGHIIGDAKGDPDRIVAIHLAHKHEPLTYVLRIMDVQRAVNLLLRDPVATRTTIWIAPLILNDEPDGTLADVILQVACFGKVRYE